MDTASKIICTKCMKKRFFRFKIDLNAYFFVLQAFKPFLIVNEGKNKQVRKKLDYTVSIDLKVYLRNTNPYQV